MYGLFLLIDLFNFVLLYNCISTVIVAALTMSFTVALTNSKFNFSSGECKLIQGLSKLY